MPDNQQVELKNRFDALETLRRMAWECIDHRRPFEWKICIALWTAFAAFIGTTISGNGLLIPWWLLVPLTSAVAVFIVWRHFEWLNGLRRAYNIDQTMADQFRDEMMKLLKIEFEEPLKNKVDEIKRARKTFRGNWNSAFQFCVTLTLASAAVIVTIPPAFQSAKHTTWDYRVLAGDISVVQREIDQLAPLGWEVASVTSVQSPTNIHEALILMKKTR